MLKSTSKLDRTSFQKLIIGELEQRQNFEEFFLRYFKNFDKKLKTVHAMLYHVREANIMLRRQDFNDDQV